MAIYKSRKLLHNRSGKSWFDTHIIHTSRMMDDEILIESHYSLVSCGTEQTILKHPPDGQMAINMRVPYMQGGFDSDFTYGYSLVGEVIEGSSEWIGKYVHVMHPHQDLLLVRKDDVYLIPDIVSVKNATLASNLETIVNAIWDSGVTVGDKVLILGFGIIGALLATVIDRIPGIEVNIYEKNPYRQKLCTSFNMKSISEVSHLTKDYNIVFNTTSFELGLQLAIDQAIYEGKIIELSWYGPKKVNLNLGDEFHYGRKVIISSQVSHIPKSKSGIFNFKSRKHIVFNMLEKINFDDLLSREVSYNDAPEFFRELREGSLREIGIVFNYKK